MWKVKTVRKNFWELLWMKVPLCSKLWIEEKCANLPVSNLHLQAHPVALYVSNNPCQPRGSEVMDPSSGTLCDRAQAAAGSSQGSFGCWHRVLSPLQRQCHTRARARWQPPVPSTIWYLCRVPLLLCTAQLHVPLEKGGSLTWHPRGSSVCPHQAPWPRADARTSRLAQSLTEGLLKGHN